MNGINDWLTVQQAMATVGVVSRTSIYNFADRYRWETMKLGNTRFYLRADVERTPDAEQRKVQGYATRSENLANEAVAS